MSARFNALFAALGLGLAVLATPAAAAPLAATTPVTQVGAQDQVTEIRHRGRHWRNRGHWRDGRHWRGHRGHYRRHWDAPRGYGWNCIQPRRVWTPYGFVVRRVNVCR